MASYCEVCQALCFTPHSHPLQLRDRTPTCENPRLHSPCDAHSAPFLSSHGAPMARSTSNGDCCVPGLRARSVPVTSGLRGVRGRRSCEPYLCPCQLHADGETADRFRGGPVRRSPCGKTFRTRSVDAWRAATPPPLPPASSSGAADRDGRYAADTCSSWQRTADTLPVSGFLRCRGWVTGRRHPSQPPSRRSSSAPPPPVAACGFLDHFPSQRVLAQRCCYPSPHPAPSMPSHSTSPPLRAAEDDESGLDSRAARPSAQAPSSLHDHHLLRKRSTGADNAGEEPRWRGAQEVSPPHDHHRHHSRSDAVPHRHASSPHDQAVQRSSRRTPVSASEATPPPLLNGGQRGLAPPDTTGISPRKRDGHRHQGQGEQHHHSMRASHLMPWESPSDASHHRPSSRPHRHGDLPSPVAAATSAAPRSVPEHELHSLGDLIAKIRAEVSREPTKDEGVDGRRASAGRTDTKLSGGAAPPRTSKGATSAADLLLPPSSAAVSTVVASTSAPPSTTDTSSSTHRSAEEDHSISEPRSGAALKLHQSPPQRVRSCSSRAHTRDAGGTKESAQHPKPAASQPSKTRDKEPKTVEYAGLLRRPVQPESSPAAAPRRHSRTISSASSSASSVSTSPRSRAPVEERQQRRSPRSLSSSSSSSSLLSTTSDEMQRAVREAAAMLRRMRRRAARPSEDAVKSHGVGAGSVEQQARRTSPRPSTRGEKGGGAATTHPALPSSSSTPTAAAAKAHTAGDEVAVPQQQHQERHRPRQRQSPSRNAALPHPGLTAPPASTSHLPLPASRSDDPPSLPRPSTSSLPPPVATAAAHSAITAERLSALERRQEDWAETQHRQLERLRDGLASLCMAVRKDLRTMRAEVRTAHELADDVAARVTALTTTTAANAKAESEQLRAPPEAPAASRASASRVAALTPDVVVAMVAQCSSAQQRQLAQLLLPHLRPALMDAVKAEVQEQLRAAARDGRQGPLRDVEDRLQVYVQEAVRAQEKRLKLEMAEKARHGAADGQQDSVYPTGVPLWADFSSADAFNAHLRATARAVLAEEDERRYSLAGENERRHERRVQDLQQHWQETLRDAQRTWAASWQSKLDTAMEKTVRRAQAPLQQHADLLQKIVKALTEDVTSLHARQDAQATAVQEALQTERAMRQREGVLWIDRVEHQVRQLLPREVEASCVRFHVQRARAAAASAAATSVVHRSEGSSGSGGGASRTASPAAPSSSTADELRLAVVQPALEHMRRVLASHQEMMTATVEERCRRAESAVEGSRHVWLQNVAELRGKLSALRSDVRGAFSELSTALNVASPAL